MDEHFRRKGLWVGLGALAIVFLCVMMCGFGSLLMASRGPVYVQPPAAEEGAAPPPPAYYGHGPYGMGHTGVHGPLGFFARFIGGLFRLAFLGLLLLLGLGLIKRIFWGHRCWGPPHGWKPPEGSHEAGDTKAAWGPWGWHRHKHWGSPPPWWTQSEAKGHEEDESDSGDPVYSGPQE
jgi:hypothetical protein